MVMVFGFIFVVFQLVCSGFQTRLVLVGFRFADSVSAAERMAIAVRQMVDMMREIVSFMTVCDGGIGPPWSVRSGCFFKLIELFVEQHEGVFAGFGGVCADSVFRDDPARFRRNFFAAGFFDNPHRPPLWVEGDQVTATGDGLSAEGYRIDEEGDACCVESDNVSCVCF